MYVNGQGVAKDTGKAYLLYEKACNGGDADGCYHAGQTCRLSFMLPECPAKAQEYWKKGCDMGYQKACDQL